MDGGRDEAAGFSHTVAALHLVALLDYGLGGSADVLGHGENHFSGKRKIFNRLSGCDFIFSGVNAADFESMEFHVQTGLFGLLFHGGGFGGHGFLHGEVDGMDCMSGTNVYALAAKLTLLVVDI